MKIAIAIAIILLISSCEKKPVSSEHIGNEIHLELLFEKDGCRMYRFRDGGRYIYWSTCEGKTQYTTSNGKNSTVTIEAITNQK